MFLTRRAASAIFLTLIATIARAQQPVSPPSEPPPEPSQDSSSKLEHRPSPRSNTSAVQVSVPLAVPAGTAVQVALDKEIRVRKVDQPIHGRVVEPVYAFDKLVIPVGAQATGYITKIESLSAFRRTTAALDTDFSPTRKLEVTFDDLILADGRHIPIRTIVAPGSGQVVQFVTADDKGTKKTAKDEASEKAKQAKAQARDAWNNAMKEIQSPGKMHRLERYAIARLPVHPQLIDAGTVYFAELQDPLDFGSEPLSSEKASTLGVLRQTNFVRARLVTPLNSATTPKGAEVQAVLSQPLFDGDHLILPQGSHLKGSVVQAAPARYLGRNGQLRIVFHELDLPDGVQQKVDTSLEGIQAGKNQDVKLDSEGGAQATSSKSRYALTAVSVGLAAVSFGGDRDAPGGSNPAGNTSNRVAGGAGGFKLIGIVLGLTVHSRAFGAAMGAYGASMSVYSHFIARGHEVVFPKNTAMQIGVASVPAAPEHQAPPSSPSDGNPGANGANR
jgi:type IV secretory pathway VirB10-like protein